MTNFAGSTFIGIEILDTQRYVESKIENFIFSKSLKS